MTKRECYLKALRNEAVDRLVWAPNIDYWRQVNAAEGALPAEYRNMSRNDIVRKIGGAIWNRVAGLKTVHDPSIRPSYRDQPAGTTLAEIATPLGKIRAVHSPTEGPQRAKALTEHYLKTPADIRVMQYVVEGTHYEPDYAAGHKALAETGPDGIVLYSEFCVPFIQFAKTDAGYLNGFYLWLDHRPAVDRLIAAYQRLFLEGYRILAAGPADVIATGDNMDGAMISPDIFREYALPFYGEAAAIIHARGKLFEGHWCGRTDNLLALAPGCGLDIVEAVVSRPMARITLLEALELLRGRVVLQGGIPSVLVCREGGSRQDFTRYIAETIGPLKGRRGFILGMSDNVPPNADFERVAAVAELIA